MPRLTLLLVAGLCAALLSGCSGGKDPCEGSQIAEGGGSLAFSGSCSGSHSSTFDCDGSAKLVAAVYLTGGEVVLTVEDAGGATVYSKTRGTAILSDEAEVTGTAGAWTVTAERKDDATGQYALQVDCEA